MTQKDKFGYIDAVRMLTHYLPVKGGVWAMSERVMPEPEGISFTFRAYVKERADKNSMIAKVISKLFGDTLGKSNFYGGILKYWIEEAE